MGAVDLSIDKLLLDSENPRIGSATSQRDALQKLIDDQEEKLYALAESIVSDAMSPIDRLLVLREKRDGDRFISLEGNRRVAALRILSNPSVLSSLDIKSSLQKRFENLATRFNSADIEPVACFEVASRDEGNKWIYLRHTGENEGRGVVGWSGVAASRFRGGDPALQALEFVKTYGNLGEKQMGLLGNNFPITTLDRLLSTREVRDLIGVEVKDRKLRSGLSPDELMKPLKRMVLDLAAKNVNVSQLKNRQEQIEYVQSFATEDKPDLSKTGKARPIEDIQSNEFKSNSKLRPPAKRRSSDPSERKTLVARTAKLNVQVSKIAGIYKEIKTLKVEGFPNAAAVLLRVFLELSVEHYMEVNGIPLRFKDPKSTRILDKSLKQKVQEVVDYLVRNKGYNKKDFAGVTRALSVERSPLYIDLLNAYVHNRFVIPKPSELKSAWDEAQRFFERIWE